MIYNDEFINLAVGDQLEYYGSKFTIERVETDGCSRITTVWLEKGVSLDLISNKAQWSIVEKPQQPANLQGVQLSLFDPEVSSD